MGVLFDGLDELIPIERGKQEGGEKEEGGREGGRAYIP